MYEGTRKKICAMNTEGRIVKIYPSIKEAIAETGISRHLLKKAMYHNYGDGTADIVGGYRWAHCVYDKGKYDAADGTYAGYIPVYRIRPDEHVNICAVDSYGSVIETFVSMQDVAEWLNVSENVINHALNGGNLNASVKGYRLRYCRNGEIAYLEGTMKQHNGRWRVCAIDRKTGEIVKVYDSAPEAARELGISVSNIGMAVSGKSKNITAGGYKWARFNGDRLKKPKKYKERKTIILTDVSGEQHTFKTYRDAAAFLGVTPGSVTSAVRTGGKCHGYTAEAVNTGDCSVNDRKYCTGRAVRIINSLTGEVLKEYPSIRLLAKDMGISYQYLFSHIDMAIKNGKDYKYRVDWA